MEQFKTIVNTSENINPVVKAEFTMDCKVIYGFDFHLVNVSMFALVFCRRVEIN